MGGAGRAALDRPFFSGPRAAKGKKTLSLSLLLGKSNGEMTRRSPLERRTDGPGSEQAPAWMGCLVDDSLSSSSPALDLERALLLLHLLLLQAAAAIAGGWVRWAADAAIAAATAAAARPLTA